MDDYNRILTLKGITDFTDKLDPKVVQSRLCVGFLSKKGKNNITRYQKRFFVLISAKPLNNEIKDDIILTENDLPPWLELETIYYFHCKHDEDKSPFVGKIALRNCISITMEDNQHECVLTSLKKDFLDFSCNLIKIKELFSWEANLGLTKPENGFGFKLTTNDRTYNFYSDLITEMNKWIIAIEQSQRNYKELHPNFKRDSIEINDVSPRKKVKTIGIKRTKTEVSDVVSNISFESMSQPLVKPTIMAKEGYLHKKTINKLQKLIGWKQRYVCLKDENIFWVASNTLTDNPRAVIAIKTIEKCQSHKENKFFLVSL